ncbi:hypothetical protein BJ165DRAFT_1535004 [Panaeolus papilionaceus]|nr:hypothetical protein BJ165DRAFT_1535004 [Panaeolus papilionaceus]
MSKPSGFGKMGYCHDVSTSSSPGYHFKGFHSSSDHEGDEESGIMRGSDPSCLVNDEAHLSFLSSTAATDTVTTAHQAPDFATQPAAQSPAMGLRPHESIVKETLTTAEPGHRQICTNQGLGAAIRRNEDPFTASGWVMTKRKKPAADSQPRKSEFYRKQCEGLRELNQSLQMQLTQSEATNAMLTRRIKDITAKYWEIGHILGLIETEADSDLEDNNNGHSSR